MRLLQSGLPYCLWPHAASVYLFNKNRSWGISRLAGKTAYEARHGEPYVKELIPFGCEVVYHDHELASKDKFEPRGSKGMFLDYSASGAIKILDLESLKKYAEEGGTIRLVVTKNAKVNPASFPASELKLEIDVTFDFDPAETGVYQCSVCNLWRAWRSSTAPRAAAGGVHTPRIRGAVTAPACAQRLLPSTQSGQRLRWR